MYLRLFIFSQPIQDPDQPPKALAQHHYLGSPCQSFFAGVKTK